MEPFHHYGHDFGLIDFLDQPHFDPYTDQQTGPIFNYGYDYQDQSNIGCDDIGGQIFPAPTSVELFDFDGATGGVGDDDNHDFGLLNACQSLDLADEEILMGEEESSGSGATTASKTTNSKGDRSRTLVSERKRRSRMKEKLYALRSLVPNITKMDKASIVGDAVLYVQNMQMQAKKLKGEIAKLESSLAGGGDNNTTQNANKMNSSSFYPITKKIFKLDVVQVEERGFYVSIVANKAKGVAMCLYKALESLTTFNVHNSNLAASADHNYVFTFTLHMITQGEIDVNLENMKLWIVSVFLNQGFEFQTSQFT